MILYYRVHPLYYATDLYNDLRNVIFTVTYYYYYYREWVVKFLKNNYSFINILWVRNI